MSEENIPFHSYGAFLKERFGEKVHKVSVDAGFTCPNLDGTFGTGGCAWCDNSSFNPLASVPERQIVDIGRQVALGVKLLKKRLGVNKFIAYFQPYSNTYSPSKKLAEIYEQALEVDGVVGLAVGTRPDCIDEEKLDVFTDIAGRGYYVQLEYGLQSADDSMLARMGRGHDSEAFARAVSMSKGRGLDICGHMICGLPGEGLGGALRTAIFMRDAGVDAVKIHSLHIVRGTRLEKIYNEEKFHLQTLSEHVETVAEILAYLPWKINIQRLWAAPAQKEQLLAPEWCMKGGAIREAVIREMNRLGYRQGCKVG